MLDPDPTYLSLPGRRIAAGEGYSRVDVTGTDFEGAFVSGQITEEDDRFSLAITPLGGGETCNVGRIERFQFRAYQFGTQNRLPMAFSFVSTQGEERYLHFVNPSCEEWLAPLPSNGLPFWPPVGPSESASSYLTLTRQGDFLRVEPWSSETSAIARGVRAILVQKNKFWSLEKPQNDLVDGAFGMVVRDDAYRQLGRVDDVTEFVIAAEPVEQATFLRDDQVFAATLPRLKEVGPIASDACPPRFPRGYRGRGVSYFSPCEARTAKVYGVTRESDPADGSKSKEYELKTNATGQPAVFFLEDRAVAFVATTDGGTPATRTLWAGYLGEELEAIATSPALGGGTPLIGSVGGEFEFLVDVEGELGRLVRWKPGTPLREIATDVLQCQDRLCLVNFDGTTGDAVLISQGGSARRLASRVARDSIATSKNGVAMVADSDGERGTLFVGDTSGKNLEEIATGVAPGGYDFLGNLEAIVYLRDFDTEAGTGILGVRVLGTGDTFDTGIRASEWRELAWPQPGLLYVIPSGDRAGVWFAALL